jgi:hypothetical protein
MSSPATEDALQTSNDRHAGKSLIIACGAIARELKAVLRASGLSHLDVVCLPAALHNTPDQIPGEIHKVLDEKKESYAEIFVAYADCGTGGQLDRLLADYDVARLPGAHCYEFFAGSDLFASLHDEEPGTFYLTDFLVRHFDRLVIEGLGLDRHPQLLSTYFGNYQRVLYLAQQPTPAIERAARACAERLELAFEMRNSGLSEFAAALEPITREAARAGGDVVTRLITIYWRAIPAQVLGRRGRRTVHKRVLHPRFQEAIDRAAMRAGKGSSNDYLADWRRVASPCEDDLEQAVAEEVARLEAMFDDRSLDKLARAKGLMPSEAPTALDV